MPPALVGLGGLDQLPRVHQPATRPRHEALDPTDQTVSAVAVPWISERSRTPEIREYPPVAQHGRARDTDGFEVRERGSGTVREMRVIADDVGW
jgi:hypothetical protein